MMAAVRSQVFAAYPNYLSPLNKTLLSALNKKPKARSTGHEVLGKATTGSELSDTGSSRKTLDRQPRVSLFLPLEAPALTLGNCAHNLMPEDRARTGFFGMAAKGTRNILVDHARNRVRPGETVVSKEYR
jgi:hypothetical protein